MSDLRPQNGPKQTLIRSLSPIPFYEYTPYMEHVLLIVCATGILLYFLLKVDPHRERKLKLLSDEYAKTRLSDEAVIKAGSVQTLSHFRFG